MYLFSINDKLQLKYGLFSIFRVIFNLKFHKYIIYDCMRRIKTAQLPTKIFFNTDYNLDFNQSKRELSLKFKATLNPKSIYNSQIESR